MIIYVLPKKWSSKSVTISAGIYLFKVNKENARAMCEIFSKVTIDYYCSLFNLGQNTSKW